LTETAATETAALCRRLQQLDADIRYRTVADAGQAWFDTVNGRSPVLLSAPHGCAHRRSGVLKMEEEFTSALAIHLAQTCGCHAIYLRHQAPEDPNFDSPADYKQAVADLVAEHGIAFVIDLHGMINKHGMGVALGTMNGRACRGRDIAGPFAAAGFVQHDVAELDGSTVVSRRRLVVNHPRFTGGIRNQTMTRYAVEELGIDAIQVEIASINRVVYSPATDDWPHAYRGKPDGIAAVCAALTMLVNSAREH